MIFRQVLASAAVSVFLILNVHAQDGVSPVPTPTPVPRISAVLAAKFANAAQSADATRENRQLAYAKLLEAQRFIWAITNSRRNRSQASITENAARAREALVSAITLDPKLDEAYTALAEISISAPPADVDEGLALANAAVKLDPNSFGARRIIARLLTYKSGLSSGSVDKAIAERAVAAWSE